MLDPRTDRVQQGHKNDRITMKMIAMLALTMDAVIRKESPDQIHRPMTMRPDKE